MWEYYGNVHEYGVRLGAGSLSARTRRNSPVCMSSRAQSFRIVSENNANVDLGRTRVPIKYLIIISTPDTLRRRDTVVDDDKSHCRLRTGDPRVMQRSRCIGLWIINAIIRGRARAFQTKRHGTDPAVKNYQFETDRYKYLIRVFRLWAGGGGGEGSREIITI